MLNTLSLSTRQIQQLDQWPQASNLVKLSAELHSQVNNNKYETDF